MEMSLLDGPPGRCLIWTAAICIAVASGAVEIKDLS